MSVTRLDSRDWLFDSNCFVCEPSNERGLRLPFDHDDERRVVTTSFDLGADYSGAPNYVHGGVILAVTDDAQAWATIAVAGKFSVTIETATRFKRPVLVGHPYTVEARIVSEDEVTIHTAATVTNAEGKVCAETTSTFQVLSPAVRREELSG